MHGIFVFLSLFLSTTAVAQPKDNYYYLAMQRCYSDDNYTIHGLWPNYANGSYPEYCKEGVHYEPSQLTVEILKNLDEYWYSCEWSSYTNYEFRDHEISKHYTCVFDEDWSQKDYFVYGLDLYHKSLNSTAVVEHCGKDSQCLVPWSEDLKEILWI